MKKAGCLLFTLLLNEPTPLPPKEGVFIRKTPHEEVFINPVGVGYYVWAAGEFSLLISVCALLSSVVHLITSVWEGVILLHEIGTHFGPLMCIKTQTDELYLEWHLHENKPLLIRSLPSGWPGYFCELNDLFNSYQLKAKPTRKERKRKDGLFFSGSYFRICSREGGRGEPFEQRENARSLPINTQKSAAVCYFWGEMPWNSLWIF